MDTRPCPACGQPNPPRLVRCGRCGARLGEDAPTGDIRRFVTVVTSDLKGSTALGERFDPETLRELLGLYFDEMRFVFEAYGGHIEKIIGDAIVAVFGPTTDRVDDALRGLEAAAETRRALASLNDRLEATWGVRLVVRTGVASGDVFFGEAAQGQQVLTGPTMTIATAMEQHCPPLEVLVAASTVELIGDRAETEPLGPVTPKGTELVIESFRLVAVRERSAAEQVATNAAAPGVNRCPACGEENPEGFTRCGMCGQTLTRSAVVHDTRKTVTIVFADPKPRTLDGSPPAPEALRDVMPRYFDAMKEALEHHGGTVEKFIGDAVMAVYGLPVRHEDDAVRAVRAAAAMQAALPVLNEEFRRDWGLELRNHIGVNTGEVIAGDASLGQRLVTGDAVNTAARLEQAAGAQEVILGPLTYLLARDQIEVAPIEPLVLKGKAEPVPAYRLTGVRQRPAERVAATTPFVGRAAEMERLRDALADAERENAARLITIIGDAGVGKSRLVREFAGSVRDEAQVLRGRCLPYGDGITFWPIGEIVRAAAEITDDDNASDAMAKIAALAAEGVSGRDQDAIVERVGAAIGLSSAQLQLPELFWGIRKLLESIARHRPLVAIVDDVQWAAPAFLELIDHLLEAVSDAPILLLLTARHELLEAHGEWAATRTDGHVMLEPLSPDDATAIIDRLLEGLDAGVRGRIAAAAEGNPLYVEQITAMLVETGALRREGDAWMATSSSGEVAIPPTVQALVAARLDALSADERAVIEPASVIGLSFPNDAVRALSDESVRPSVPAQLTSLAAKQLIRVATDSEEELYRFAHLVVKDTTYGSLLKRTRAALHEQFVDWAERENRARGRGAEFEEIHGYHLEQAYRYRTELGPLDEHATVLARRAADKLASAGRRALARTDMAAASGLLGRATALLPDADPVRAELLPELAEAEVELGEIPEAHATISAAIEAARATGDDRLLARALVGELVLGVYAPDLVELAGQPDAIADRLISTLEQFADDAGLARAWRARAMIKSKAGQYDAVATAAEYLIEHAARAGDARLVARGASVYANQAVYGSRTVEELTTRIQAYLEEVRGDRKAEAKISLGLSQLEAMRGEFERARALYRRGQELLRDLGPSVSAMITSIESGRVESLAGDYRAAAAELVRDDAALAEIGERYYRSSIVAALARVRLLAGNLEEAAAACDVVEEIADPDDTDAQVLLRSVRARLYARAGDAEQAVRSSEDAVRLSAETADVTLQADVLVDQGLALLDIGRRDAAEPPLRAALHLYQRKGDVVSAARTQALLGAEALA